MAPEPTIRLPLTVKGGTTAPILSSTSVVPLLRISFCVISDPAPRRPIPVPTAKPIRFPWTVVFVAVVSPRIFSPVEGEPGIGEGGRRRTENVPGDERAAAVTDDDGVTEAVDGQSFDAC